MVRRPQLIAQPMRGTVLRNDVGDRFRPLADYSCFPVGHHHQHPQLIARAAPHSLTVCRRHPTS